MTGWSGLSSRERQTLLGIARDSIAHGLTHGCALPDVECAGVLAEPGASFVTLHRNGRLRGCIGALSVTVPLARDTAEHAFAAAFLDPRFPRLARDEFDGLSIEVSVLGAPEPIEFGSEDDLTQALRPGVDGLIIEQGRRRATFLPAVWETLSEPAVFLSELKRKAGITSTPTYAARYVTQSFAESSG